VIQKLIAYVSRLSGREKVFFYGAAAALFLVGLDKVMFGPIWDEIEQKDEEIRVLETSVEHKLALLRYKDKIEKELKKYGKYLTPPKDDDVEIEEIMVLLDKLSKGSGDGSVLIKTKRAISPRDESVSRKYRVRLTCEGEMTSVLDFLYAVEGSEKLLEIERWTIAVKQEGSSVVTCSMEIARTVILN